MKDKRTTSELQVESKGDRLEGRYANYFEVGHNATEVVLVFGQFYQSQESPLMHTQIITNPESAGDLAETLREILDGLEGSMSDLCGVKQIDAAAESERDIS